MATKKKTAAKSAPKQAPELLFEEGYWWIVSGTKRLNAGRSERYARAMLAGTK